MFVCMSLGVAAQRVYDTDLSDDAWTLIELMLPVPRFGSRPRTTNVCAVLNAMGVFMQLIKLRREPKITFFLMHSRDSRKSAGR
jgi:hypothetical protein